MNRFRIAFAMFALTFAVTAAAQPVPLLPAPSAELPSVSLEYVQIPFETFSYANGKLLAQWDARRYRIDEVYVTADLEIVGPYTPGQSTKLAIDDGHWRYDFVGWMVERGTSERRRFLTPLWRPDAMPPAIDAGDSGSDALACTLDESVQCPDGSSVRVSCSGDTGSCSSCSAGATACCVATKRQAFQGAGGRVQVVEIITRESQVCPGVTPTPKQ